MRGGAVIGWREHCAGANEINERQRNQAGTDRERRENGSLTPSGQAHLEKQEAAIHHEVKSRRNANGGTLKAQERAPGSIASRIGKQTDLPPEARRATPNSIVDSARGRNAQACAQKQCTPPLRVLLKLIHQRRGLYMSSQRCSLHFL